MIGYRLQRADHFGRRVNTWLWSLAVRTLFRLRVRDINCAFKLLSRDTLDRGRSVDRVGAVISTELLVGARLAGLPSRRSACTTTRGRPVHPQVRAST